MTTTKKYKTSNKSKTRKSKKIFSKKVKQESKNFLKILVGIVSAIFVVILCFQIIPSKHQEEEQTQGDMPTICKRVEENYGKLIDSCSYLIGVPPEYVKALTCLECSGRTDMPKRFEKHVYKRLKDVRDGKKSSYEGVTSAMIKDANDDALKNLATSWGPFQIMGYKCLHLNINVVDLRGNEAVYWGIKWIKGEYGHLLNAKRYKDAFHYHNAGCVFPSDGKPKTYDKDYVPNGLEYMKWF